VAKIENRFVPDPLVTSLHRGSEAASGTLKLGSTSHATKGKVYLGEAMTGVIVDEVTGYTGIGIAPTSPIHFQPVAADQAYGTRITWTPTSTAADQIGIFANVAYTPGGASTRAITGARFDLTTEGTQNTTGQLAGLEVKANHNSSGTASKLYGARVSVSGSSIGTITDQRGVTLFLGCNTSQTITASYGVRLDYQTDGTVTTHYALYSSGGSAANTDYGLYLNNTSNYLKGTLLIGDSGGLPGTHALSVAPILISANGQYVCKLSSTVTVSSGTGGVLFVTGTLGANSSPSACTLYGINCDVSTTGATTLANHDIKGAYIAATAAVSSNPPASITGAQILADNSITGTVTSVYGLRVKVNHTGNVSNGYGILIERSGAGTLSGWTGLYIPGGASGYNAIGFSCGAPNNLIGSDCRLTIGSYGSNEFGQLHINITTSNLNGGVYVGYDASTSSSQVALSSEKTSKFPWLGFNAKQTTGDVQQYCKTDSAFRLVHDTTNDVLTTQYAASGTTGTTITFTNALQVNTSGRLFVGVATHPDQAALHVREASTKAAFRVETDSSGNYPNWQVFQFRGTTTNATATDIASLPLATGRTYGIQAFITGHRTGGTAGVADDGAFYVVRCLARNAGGTVTLTNVLVDYTGEHQAAWVGTLVASTSNVVARVTGATNNNVSWYVTYFLFECST